MTTVARTSLLDALRRHLAARAERRAAARAEHARLKKYRHVATIRATVEESNFITDHVRTYQGYAYLLENGYGQRKVTANCSEMKWSAPAEAFLSGMDLADVARMRGPLSFNAAA